MSAAFAGASDLPEPPITEPTALAQLVGDDRSVRTTLGFPG